MGAAASSGQLVTAFTLLRLEAIPEDAAGAEAAFARLIPSTDAVSAVDVFTALEPDHVREMQRFQPRNLARLVIKAVEILEAAAVAPKLHANDAVPHVRTMNASRLLTRIVPILLEDEGGFASRLFWGGEVPALGAGAPRGGSAAAARSGNAAAAPQPSGDAAASAPANGAAREAAAAAAVAAAPAAAAIPVGRGDVWERRGWAHNAEHDPPLGTALLHSVMTLLFAPDLCLHPAAYSAFATKLKAAEARDKQLRAAAAAPPAGSNTGAAAAAADVGATAANAGAAAASPSSDCAVEGERDGIVPSTSNAVWPTLLWAGGVGFPTLHVMPSQPVWLSNRCELLRLLSVLCSGVLYAAPDAARPARSRFLDAATSPHCPFAPSLFFSLLNTVLSYDPVGMGVPYALSLVADRDEPLACLAAQTLLALLDYAPLLDGGAAVQFNVHRSLLATLSSPSDLGAAFGGLARLLAAVPSVEASAGSGLAGSLPGAYAPLGWHRELLVLLWKLCDENAAFVAHVLAPASGAVTRLTAPLLWIMAAGRNDPTAVGVLHLCTFLLMLLSGDREFGVSLNARIDGAGAGAGGGGVVSARALHAPALHVDLPALSAADCGTHADLLIVTLHKLIVDGSPRLSPLYSCFLTVIQNVSSYARGLSLVSAVRLMGLVELFSSPAFLFAREHNAAFVAQLLDALANVVQYQFSSNGTLAYTLIRRAAALERLEALSVTRYNAEAAQRAARRAALAAAKGGDVASAGGAAVAAAPAEPGVAESEWVERNAAATAALAAPKAAPMPPRPAGADGDAPWVATDAWLDALRATLPLGLLRAVCAYCTPRIEAHVAAAHGGVDEEGVVAFLAGETLVGVLPVPHAIVMRRYAPNAFTQLWFTTFLWSTLFLRLGRELPVFDAKAVKLFAISVVKT